MEIPGYESVRMEILEMYCGRRVIVFVIVNGRLQKFEGKLHKVKRFDFITIECNQHSLFIEFIGINRAIVCVELPGLPVGRSCIFKNSVIRDNVRWTTHRERENLLVMSFGEKHAWEEVLRKECKNITVRILGWIRLFVLNPIIENIYYIKNLFSKVNHYTSNWFPGA